MLLIGMLSLVSVIISHPLIRPEGRVKILMRSANCDEISISWTVTHNQVITHNRL